MDVTNYPKVFIIILNWNGWRMTQQCLLSCLDINYPNYELVLVDNDSNEFEKREIKTSKLRNKFVLIENESNLGFAGGNNRGIEYALGQKADYVLILNNDTVCEDKDFLKKMIETSEADLQVGVVGPKIFLPHKKTVWFGGGKINWLKTKGFHIRENPLDYVRKVDYITGCCFLVKAKVVRKVGLMEEDYFLYYEDVDWCLKIKEVGYYCVYNPHTYIIHDASSSIKEFSESYIYYHTRNALMLAWKHNGFLKKFLVILFSIWKATKQLVKLAMGHKKKWARAVLRGIFHFYLGKTGPL